MVAKKSSNVILKFSVIFCFINYCHTTRNYGGYSGGYGTGFGSGYSGGGGIGFYGEGVKAGFTGGFGDSYGGGFVSNVGGHVGGVIPAAIISRHSFDIRNVGSQYAPITPQIIEVDAGVIPLTIHFKSASSKINVIQSHQGSGGGEESTYSEDAPHLLYHSVTKPIIQEVREVITPYRRVIQEIQPVQEEVKTIVARGEPRYGGAGIGRGVAFGGGVSAGISGGFKGFGGLSAGGYGDGAGYGVGSGGGYGVSRAGIGYAVGRAGGYAGGKPKY